MKNYFCYILANKQYGTLYVGVTNDLVARVYQHKTGEVDGFTKKYRVNQLVWYETHDRIEQAIVREKQLKEWQRAWKYRLIREMNPDWEDLYDTIVG